MAVNLRTFRLTALLTTALGIALPLEARIKNVPDDFQRIQTAIDSSANGDTVLIAPGTYRETIDFLGRNITVAGQYLTTGDEGLINRTMISGNIGNNRSVVSIRTGESSAAQLIGLTIRDGRAVAGAGIFIAGSSPVIRRVRITRCLASVCGGGIYATRVSMPIIRDCIIDSCQAAEFGGAVAVDDGAEIRIETSDLRRNQSNKGGGLALHGTRSRPPSGWFEGVNFTANQAISNGNRSTQGGGAYLIYSDTVRNAYAAFVGCKFEADTAY